MISNYFHALPVHGPMQHEVVSCRSTNTENEERIFKSAESAAKCNDHKPENMLPGVLKRLQCKRNQKTSNPLLKLRKENSRISQSASKLPPYPGTIFKEEFIIGRTDSYKAHLKRISPYLKCGEGVWWHRDSCGSFVSMTRRMVKKSHLKGLNCYISVMLQWKMLLKGPNPVGRRLLKGK